MRKAVRETFCARWRLVRHDTLSAEDFIGCDCRREGMTWPPSPPGNDDECREMAMQGQLWMRWLVENHPIPKRVEVSAANIARLYKSFDAGEMRHAPMKRRRVEFSKLTEEDLSGIPDLYPQHSVAVDIRRKFMSTPQCWERPPLINYNICGKALCPERLEFTSSRLAPSVRLSTGSPL